LRELYDELLPNFSSRFFNVGGDETWDLGRGQSAARCARLGKGNVYVAFLKQIHREVTRRKRRMMFWGDIILTHPELLAKLPRDLIALAWGYEAGHPFADQAATFARSGLQFYVCPGTSTWMTVIGRHDNALANLRAAARAGRQHGAIGYLNCDWGDGGHPQPLAVSWPLYAAGAGLSWCAQTFAESQLAPVLNRDIYHDPLQNTARAALELGRAHLKFGYRESNLTPFGTVIAAPPPHTRELFCRNGLKLYARIAPGRVAAAQSAVRQQRQRLLRGQPSTSAGRLLKQELDLAARLAEQSCHFMQWQQALAAGKTDKARTLARAGMAALRRLDREFTAYWPKRNKATPKHCSAFIKWRLADYRSGKLHFPPEVARQSVKKHYAAE
jgi:hypothetical protein